MTDNKTQVSLRIPRDVLTNVDRVATALERDRTWVMLRALRAYLDEEGAEILSELEAMNSLDRGEGVDFDDVLGEAESIVDRTRRESAGRRA